MTLHRRASLARVTAPSAREQVKRALSWGFDGVIPACNRFSNGNRFFLAAGLAKSSRSLFGCPFGHKQALRDVVAFQILERARRRCQPSYIIVQRCEPRPRGPQGGIKHAPCLPRRRICKTNRRSEPGSAQHYCRAHLLRPRNNLFVAEPLVALSLFVPIAVITRKSHQPSGRQVV